MPPYLSVVEAEEAVESERDEDKQVVASYTYDIKVLDKDGDEIQPAGENGEDSSSRVKVPFHLGRLFRVCHRTYPHVLRFR